MPNIPPETYKFSAYISYVDGDSSKPRIIAYWSLNGQLSDQETDALQKHADDEAIEFLLVVTRTVTENLRKQPVIQWDTHIAGENTEAAQAAINYLKQLHPNEFEQFAQSCWQSAWAKLNKNFPQAWPKD